MELFGILFWRKCACFIANDHILWAIWLSRFASLVKHLTIRQSVWIFFRNSVTLEWIWWNFYLFNSFAFEEFAYFCTLKIFSLLWDKWLYFLSGLCFGSVYVLFNHFMNRESQWNFFNKRDKIFATFIVRFSRSTYVRVNSC